MFIVMLTACSRHNDEFSAATDEPGEPSVLRIYVYQPDRPIVTRAGEGEVNPINNTLDESTINNIHIWVFNTNDKALIAYHSNEGAASDLSIVNDDGVVYQLAVSPAFEAAAVKPNVDVYVLANDTRFDGSTTAAQLEAAIIEGSNYGPATLTQLVRTIITKIGGIAGAAWGDWFQLIFAIAMVVLAVILVIEGIGTFAKQNKQKA